jgi:hypothetical protein
VLQHGAAIMPVIVLVPTSVTPGSSSAGTPKQPLSKINNAEIKIIGKMILVLSFI